MDLFESQRIPASPSSNAIQILTSKNHLTKTMAEFTLQAIVFQEGHGPGHVLLSQLTGGTTGLVYLVKSLLDGKFYVRKELRIAPNRIPSEVSVMEHISPTCPTPALISSHRCRTYEMDGNTPSREIHTLYFDFCNGGNMGMLLENFWQRQQPIPELFIWHFLARITEIVAGLQLGWTTGAALTLDQDLQKRSVVFHGDLSSSNVFLNWPSDDSVILPDIFLGDFGNASILSSDSANADDLLEDIAHIGTQLIDLVDTYNIEAFNFDDVDEEEIHTWRDRFPTLYSAELFTWCGRLDTFEVPSAKEMVTDLLPVAERHIERLLAPLRGDPRAVGLLRWTQPRLPDQPLLFHETERFTSKSILSPLRNLQNHWHFRPVAVSEATYNQTCSFEARTLQAHRAESCEEFLLADAATEPPHYRCPTITTSNGAAPDAQ
jgi:hypothetical protein